VLVDLEDILAMKEAVIQLVDLDFKQLQNLSMEEVLKLNSLSFFKKNLELILLKI